MRGARIQAQDLNRTSQFVNTLLSKDDVKDLDKADIHDSPKPAAMVNGNKSPFRPDPKTRFSEPPAPPPQQPLPEKPDVPSLKRATTERPKSGPPNTSPVRQDNLSQIIQLTEALNNAKRDMDSQSARMRELEQMLLKEREARELAEEFARRLEDSTTTSRMNGSGKPSVPEVLDEAFKLEEEDKSPIASEASTETLKEPDASAETATVLQSRIDSMDAQMRDLRGQMEHWKQQCEVAESERDADRKTLAEMVLQLRAEEARRVAAQEKGRSRSRRRRTDNQTEDGKASGAIIGNKEMSGPSQSDGSPPADDLEEDPTLSRANTITPLSSQRARPLHDHRLQAGLPYASMLGVVLIGMGLMTYINGWQSPPPRIEQ